MLNLIDKCKSIFFQDEAFLLIGNINASCRLFRKKFGLLRPVSEYGFCIAEHATSMHRFVSCIGAIVNEAKHETGTISFFNSTTLGFDSTSISYKSYEFDQDVDKNVILMHIKHSIMGRNIIHYGFHPTLNKVFVLTARTAFLSRVREGLRSVGVKIIRFVAEKYVSAALMNIKYGNYGLTMVLQIGYRSTNMCVFDGDFLIYYETMNFGTEEVIMAFKDKSGVSLDKAEEMIFETPLTEYVEHMKQKLPDIISFYFSSLVRKFFYFKQIPDPQHIIVSGIRTPGFANIVKKFVPRAKVTVVDYEMNISEEWYKSNI